MLMLFTKLCLVKICTILDFQKMVANGLMTYQAAETKKSGLQMMYKTLRKVPSREENLSFPSPKKYECTSYK